MSSPGWTLRPANDKLRPTTSTGSIHRDGGATGPAHFGLGAFEQAATALEQRLERNPHSETTYALLACSYGHLGRMAESRVAWEKTLELKPDFSLERRRRILPFRNPEDFERRVEGLRKAGLVV